MKRAILLSLSLALACAGSREAKAPKGAPASQAAKAPDGTSLLAAGSDASQVATHGFTPDPNTPTVTAPEEAGPATMSAAPSEAPEPAPAEPAAEQPPAKDPAPQAEAPKPPPKPLDQYDALLKAHVSGGKVDYAGITKERAALDAFLKSVASTSGSPGLAFYINAYNALVIAALIDNGLPAKVTDVKGFFDVKKYKVAGKEMTLNELEGMIRKTYKDARIHFALNCGARSCPPLPGRAFRESSLEKTLGELTTRFLNGSGVKIDEAKKEIQLTRLMDWYGQDFKDNEGSLEAYLKKYTTDATKKAALEKALSDGYKLNFQFYDWSLNKK